MNKQRKKILNQKQQKLVHFRVNETKIFHKNNKKFLNIISAQISEKNNELILFIKKHTDTLIEQTKTKPQETLDFKMKKQMETFSFSPPINLIEEDKWLLAVSLFEAMNSVFNTTHKSNSFYISTPGHWNSEDSEEFINELKKLFELRSQNGMELHVDQVRKKGFFLINDFSLSSRGTFKNEIVEELKKIKYNDLEDLV